MQWEYSQRNTQTTRHDCVHHSLGSGKDGLFRPQLDLALLSRATVMIGHCPSSFTAVAARQREAVGLPTTFWGLPPSVGVAMEAVNDASIK